MALAKRLGGDLAEVATPAVLCDLTAHGVAGAVSARRYGIKKHKRAIGRSPRQAMAAAFFDSLIAQQDRHASNFRWNEPPWMFRLPSGQPICCAAAHRPTRGGRSASGSSIMGSASRAPGDFVRPDRRSMFLDWRHDRGLTRLTPWEQQRLDALRSDPALHGLADFLESDRAQALADRVELMRRRGTVLDRGEW